MKRAKIFFSKAFSFLHYPPEVIKQTKHKQGSTKMYIIYGIFKA